MPYRQVEFFKLLSTELTPEKLLDRFLKLLMDIQNVERGSIWVKKGDFHVCLHAAGEQSETIQGLTIPANTQSIVGWVIDNGRRTVAEAGRDARHFTDAEKQLQTKSNLILAFPLILSNGSVYGCVEVIDVSARGRRMNLSDEYLELLQSLVDVCSIALSNSVAFKDVLDETDQLRRTVAAIRTEPLIKGPSRAFDRALRLAESYSATGYPVLVTGESGTGKEVLAREIHRMSIRKDRPFLVQNCSAIPATLLASELFGYKKGAFTGALGDKIGLLEAADGGTVFLDEIGDMGIDLQASLLRALQDGEIKPLGSTKPRKVDVRLISATNKDLGRAIEQGEFRHDLFFRLNVLPLELPPLRERKDDLPYFLTHFIAREASRLNMPAKRVSPAAMQALMAYDWPGNVRELENLVKQLLATADGPEIDFADLPSKLRAGDAAPDPEPALREPSGQAWFQDKTWSDMEREYILHLLEKNRWVVSRAAEDAGLKRSTFDSRMKKLGIRKNEAKV
jgi:transcriptional regulator with GAF, ATPase, and Fis domain